LAIENVFTTDDELYKAFSKDHKERESGASKEVLRYREAIWYGNKQYPIDPILKMIISHLQFEAIHPFRDGNGRTGRILNVLYLKQKGLLNMPILYMSKYILRTKDQYYHTISGVTQRADWQNYILCMLDVVRATSYKRNKYSAN